jgi:hypothetical protein
MPADVGRGPAGGRVSLAPPPGGAWRQPMESAPAGGGSAGQAQAQPSFPYGLQSRASSDALAYAAANAAAEAEIAFHQAQEAIAAAGVAAARAHAAAAYHNNPHLGSRGGSEAATGYGGYESQSAAGNYPLYPGMGSSYGYEGMAPQYNHFAHHQQQQQQPPPPLDAPPPGFYGHQGGAERLAAAHQFTGGYSFPRRHESPALPEVTHLLGSALADEVNIVPHESAQARTSQGPPQRPVGSAWGGRAPPPAPLDAGGLWGGGASSWSSRGSDTPIGGQSAAVRARY